ncbi:MAG: hypothetical protein AAFO75_07205 [Pseudomonadota bacterium]
MAGCAADGGLDLTTGSLTTPAPTTVAKAPAIDPVCIELTAKIDALRKEGTPERIAKVATGKTSTANVKRTALARMTELDAANQQFQAKCSKISAPAPRTAAVAPAPVSTTAATTAATAAATTAATTAAKAAAVKAATASAPKAAATAASVTQKAADVTAKANQSATAATTAAALAKAATTN